MQENFYPYLPPDKEIQKPIVDPIKSKECTMNKPLNMVIPPQGCYIHCPVHVEHFIKGQQITC